MELSITARHMEVGKELKQYIRKRFRKWTTFLAAEAEVHVILAIEKFRNQVEVTVKHKRYSLTAQQTSKDMYAAIDLLAEKVGQQLARQHDKLSKEKSGVSLRRLNALAAEPSRREATTGQIVDIQPMGGKPMTREEAALQLQSGRQPYLVFEDVETGQLSVLNRRKDGNFTLIVKE